MYGGRATAQFTILTLYKLVPFYDRLQECGLSTAYLREGLPRAD